MNRDRRFTLYVMLVMMTVGLVALVACAGLNFKIDLQQRLALAKEGGYQFATQFGKLYEFGHRYDAPKEVWQGFLTETFTEVRTDLADPTKILDVEWAKIEVYDAVEGYLDKFKVSVDPDLLRIIKNSQNFFSLECIPDPSEKWLCEMTPTQRVLGQGFCDGVLEGLKGWDLGD